jgi:4-hydroxybenzoate polyprenyltransferase
MSQFRLIVLFVLAVFALVWTGYLLNPVTNLVELVLLLALSGGGTAIIYGYDFAQLKRSGYDDLVSKVLNSPIETLFYFLFIVFLAPLSFFYLSSFRINTMLIICLFGLIYSMPFTYKGKRIKLKQIVFVKNIFIGFSWGALILVGAGSVETIEIKAYFTFVSLQVVTGSMIRDLYDVEKDKKDAVITVPVKFGIPFTIQLLYLINLLSVWPLLFVSLNNGLILMLPVLLWRFIVIRNVSRNQHSILWTQTSNIMTCVILGIIVAIDNLLL